MLKLLLTTHHLTNYGGSELVTLDLATEFQQAGWDVIVATFQLGGEIEKDFKTSGVEIFNVLNEPLPQIEFDLVWSHHYPVLIKCLIEDSVTTKSLILSSLSPYEPLEAIPFFHAQADLILCNSDETKQEIIKDKNCNYFDESKLFIFKNSVPFHWFDLSLDRKGLELKKVAIISNHPPIEILEAINILKTKGIDTDLIGIHGTPKLVNIDLLTSYDAIITIGRTTQHCMALNIPVFCYDRFGGPGWLTPDNFQLAEWFNYSGRCCHQKISSQQIVTELIDGFSKVKSDGEFFKTYSFDNYSLKKNIDAVLDLTSITNKHPQPYITFDDEKVVGKVGKAYQNVLKDKEASKDELDRSQAELDRSQAELTRSQLQLQQAQAELTRSQSQLQQARSDRQNYLNIIKSMETSKFWQLREVWLQAKKVFRYFEKS
jgi:O-antigen biosynthesis protein